MKLRFVVLMVLVFSVFSFAQTSTSTYQILFNGVDESLVSFYDVYYEELPTASGFQIYDGRDLSQGNFTVPLLTTVNAAGQSQYSIEITENDDEWWVMVGVVARNSLGQISLMGATLVPVQKQSTRLPKPSTVIFQVVIPQ